MVERREIPWPQIADGKVDQGEVPRLFRIDDVPNFVLIDRAGRLAGRASSDREVEKRIPDLLAPATFTPAPPPSPRDAWQRPQQLMDLLGVMAGTRVADIGAGDGYFTFHLAARVGGSGRVYAVDIDNNALERLKERAEREGLPQVSTVPSATDDPRLDAASVDVVLVVNAYHEFRDFDAMMRGMAAALAPGGRLAILDHHGPIGRPRADYHQRHNIPAELVIEDGARHGLRLVRFEHDFAGPQRDRDRYYLVVLERPSGN